MRAARCLLLLVVAACGGGETKPATALVAPAAPQEPLVEGRTVTAWIADLDAAATSRGAAAVLARIAASEPRALPALTKALANSSDDVRRAASDAFEAVGEAGVSAAAEQLGAESEATRTAAGDALVRIGAAGLRRLVNALGDSNSRVSAAAAAALVRAGPAAVQPLTDGLLLGNAAGQRPAAKCLVELGAAPALVSALSLPSVRGVAADALRSMGPSAAPALLALASSDRDDRATRALAAEMLSKLWGFDGTADGTVLASFDKLRSRQASDRDDGVRGIGVAGSSATPAIPAIVALLRDGDAGRRGSAADALGAIGPPARAAVPDLEAARADPDEDVAARAKAALAVISPAPPPKPRATEDKPATKTGRFDETAWRKHLDAAIEARDGRDYAVAEAQFAAALDLLERAGLEDLRLADTLFNQGILLAWQHRWPEAEAASRRSIMLREKLESKPSTDLAWSFNNLADALRAQDRDVEAEAMIRQALALFERFDPPQPGGVAHVSNQLATILSSQNRYDEALKYVERALAAWRKLHGEDHQDVGRALNNLGAVQRGRKQYAEAERAYLAAAAVWMKVLGARHRWTYMPYHNLGQLYQDQRRWADAEKVYRRAMELQEAANVGDSDRADTMEELAKVLRALGRKAEANKVDAEVQRLRQ